MVAAAIEQISPNTKLWWSPNVGSDADYAKYYPKKGRVDVVGFDYVSRSTLLCGVRTDKVVCSTPTPHQSHSSTVQRSSTIHTPSMAVSWYRARRVSITPVQSTSAFNGSSSSSLQRRKRHCQTTSVLCGSTTSGCSCCDKADNFLMFVHLSKFENGKTIEFRIVDTQNKGANINSATSKLLSSMMG